MRRALIAAPLVLSVLSACGGTGDSEGPIATSSAPVINGVVDTPAKYDSTILIQTEVGGGMGAGCTATLITPHVAITARHCVSEYSRSSGFGADYTPSKMYIWYGSEPRGSNDNVVVRIVHNGSSTIDDNDFAIIVLKDAATRIPFSPIRLAKPPVKNETVAVAGYGVTETDTPTTLGAGLHKRYRRESLRIAYVGPVPSYYIGAREIVLGESICQGDSGGPVYAQGTKALLAVTSRGGNGQREDPAKPWAGCVGTSAVNYFTRVDGFTDLIKKTVGEVGELLWEEGAPKPEQPTTKLPDPGSLGAYCAAPADCASKLCVDWAGSKVCSQTCTDTCPTGFDCAGGYCVKAAESTTPPDEVVPVDPASAATPQTVQSGGCSVGRSTGSSAIALGMLAVALVAARRRRH